MSTLQINLIEKTGIPQFKSCTVKCKQDFRVQQETAKKVIIELPTGEEIRLEFTDDIKI